jgi:hypothetical protein
VLCLDPGIELPKQLSRGSIESDYLFRGCIGVEDPPNDQRICLDYAFFTGVVGPLHLELRHIVPVDLGQGRIVLALDLPSIDGPIDVRLLRLSGGIGQHPTQRDQGHERRG